MSQIARLYDYISSSYRSRLYTVTIDDDGLEKFSYANPVFSFNADANRNDSEMEGEMRLRDFLASIPSFAEFSDTQLITLEEKATFASFNSGSIIFKQGDPGDAFYVIQHGKVEVLVQSNPSLLKKGDYGKVVNDLSQGFCFGERALLTSEPRAATIRALHDTDCLVFSRAVYEAVIGGSMSLLGKDFNNDVDFSKDHETRSLYKHLESILEIDSKATAPRIKRTLYELSTAFTPELSADEVISRMVITVKTLLKVDRVGLFVLSEDRRSMVLKVSERSKGIRLPVRGLAGAVLNSNQVINIADAYQDSRFDPTMDRRTGYRTRQVLGVPIHHPVTKETVGLLQVNNRSDGSLTPFTNEQEKMLVLAADQLSEILHGREEVFIHSGMQSKSQYFGSNDGSTVLNTSDISIPFHLEVSSITLTQPTLDILSKESLSFIEVSFSIFQALTPLCSPQTITINIDVTPKRGISSQQSIRNGPTDSRYSDLGSSHNIQINEKLKFDIFVKDLPRAARILIRIGGRKKAGAVSRTNLGWAASTIFDFKACAEGIVDLKFFPGDNNVPINTTLSNNHDPIPPTILSMVLLSDLLFPDGGVNRLSVNGVDGSNKKIGAPARRIVHTMPLRADPIGDNDAPVRFNEDSLKILDRIRLLSFNPISSILSDEDKDFIWDNRYNILDRADLLPAFVISVKWNQAEKVQELYDLLDLWRPPSPVLALQLLDRRFMDPKVRAFAAHCLEELNDEELGLYMLQLCQQLKFESYVDSALSRFLLRRALTNQRLIGHIFFWFLQSEIYNLDVKRRFSSLLEIYIRNCGNHRVELGHQMFVMKRLERVAEEVVKGESKSERLEILREQLRVTVLPPEFQLPLNPLIKVKGIDISKCRVMESKKKPLWLTLKNADPKGTDIVLMLKVGDDLRQDALILQLLRVMYELWRREGLDMQMNIYGCISTGFERGLLQVVRNATTIGSVLLHFADQQAKQGGGVSKSGSLSRKFNSALKAITGYEVLKDWVYEQVCDDVKDEDKRSEEMERRTHNFMISTAAYCVASYVLGIGDRHNDNLMITKSANFFHIDFGHILGNFKAKFGIKRERAPFVFTPAMRAVMDDSQYQVFVDLCCDIYNVLRENASLLVSLCSLAIPCNLPELQKEEDVVWIYEKLLVGATDEEASKHFISELEASLHTRGTRLNDAAHMLAHA